MPMKSFYRHVTTAAAEKNAAPLYCKSAVVPLHGFTLITRGAQCSVHDPWLRAKKELDHLHFNRSAPPKQRTGRGSPNKYYGLCRHRPSSLVVRSGVARRNRILNLSKSLWRTKLSKSIPVPWIILRSHLSRSFSVHVPADWMSSYTS